MTQSLQSTALLFSHVESIGEREFLSLVISNFNNGFRVKHRDGYSFVVQKESENYSFSSAKIKTPEEATSLFLYWLRAVE